MKGRIIEFVNLLRENGINIGISEEIDAFNSIILVGVESEKYFKSALQSTLIKNNSEIPVFEKLYNNFFKAPSLQTFLTNLSIDKEKNNLDAHEYALEKEIEEKVRKLILRNNISTPAKYLLLNDFGKLELLIRNTGKKTGTDSIYLKLQERYFENAILKEIDFENILKDLYSLEEYLKMELPIDYYLQIPLEEKIKNYIKNKESILRNAVRGFVNEERLRNQYKKKEISENLHEKDFYLYTAENEQEMEKAVERLTRKLKNLFTVKRKKRYLGKIDIKRTIKESIKYEGIPFKPVYTKKIKNKGKVVLLCDISGSVLYAAKFMLQFSYTLQSIISRVRSFVFIDELGEVTDYFKRYSFSEAMKKIFSGEVISRDTYTYYGIVFRKFYQNYFDDIDRKTLLIILGDARNNYAASNEDYLREIKNKVYKIIWLNPEIKGGWGAGDSIMDIYSIYCDAVYEVRNIKLLCEAIENISRNFII